jgi:hypothetical protein
MSTSTQEKKKCDLQADLRTIGEINMGGNKEQLQAIARAKGIELKKTVTKVREGWYNKAKGLKQIAYERKLLDVHNVHLYSKDGPKDAEGNPIDESFSLKNIVGRCTDFIEEKTLLQHMMRLKYFHCN